MSIYFNSLTTKTMIGLFSLLVGSTITFEPATGATRFPSSDKQLTIVVDPGHGGHERGVRGPSGTFEKTIALQFAQILQACLKDRYRVTITRTSDYALDYIARVNFANHTKADLFVSIHTGGGFRHLDSGITIFYFSPFSVPGKDQHEKQPLIKTERPPSPNPDWHDLQIPQVASSRRLAKILQQHIGQPPTSLNCIVYSAPLLLLEGLNMPAILFEIGTLSNPTEEKNLNNPEFLMRMAEAVCQGIDMFFQNVNR